jgi:DNA-binding MarR family transcriptional regulator
MLLGGVADHVDRIVEQWGRERPELDIAANALMARILRSARTVELAIAAVFARYGINRGEFDVLASLRRSGPPFALGPSRLSEGLLLSTGAMTNRIDGLERLGLVRRGSDPADRRVVLVELTQEGLVLIDDAFPALLGEEERLLQALPAADREALGGLLRELLSTWEADGPVDEQPSP